MLCNLDWDIYLFVITKFVITCTNHAHGVSLIWFLESFITVYIYLECYRPPGGGELYDILSKRRQWFTAGLQYKLIYISKVLIVFNYFIQSNYSALYLITILMNNNYNNFRSTESINSFYLLSHWKRTRLYGFISSNQEFVVFTFSLLCSILDYFLLCSYVTLKISKM